ncbi:heavy metal translocating P-type ATPase [Hyphomicrobium denitrificans]|nr:heavy metal translocating P-type ATPase [Hyphomicrobium denitrificans]
MLAEPEIVGDPLKMRVEGMDCGSCALKIENALKRLPGVSDIAMTYATETLVFRLDKDRTKRAVVEDKIRALGFTPLPAAGTRMLRSEQASDADDGRDRLWWRTRKGVFVLGTGALLAIAYAISIAVPSASYWAYLGAAIVGLVPIARRAVTGALSGTPFGIETLMTVAGIGAVSIGAAEEAAVVVFLFAVGEVLESIAAGRARAGIKALMNLVPRTALVEQASETREIPAEKLAVGDIALVRPGDRIPSDGEIIEGNSDIDEAPVTGESVPIAKAAGDAVFAGSINTSSSLRVRISRTAADNTIARIIHLVEEAQGSKAPTARFIDRFAAYYTPAAMVVSALIILAPPLLFAAEWSTWIYRGLATLLIACPCALVISTPAAIASGLAAGARRGLLIKGGAALETLGRVVTVAFDKTGTLTVGRPEITDIVAVDGEEAELLAKAAAVERGSSHPLGLAIISAAEKKGLSIPQAFGGSTAVPGKAVTARLKSGFVSVGSPRYAAEVVSIPVTIDSRIDALEAEGKTVVVVLASKRIAGLIALRDEPRRDAAQAVTALKRIGVRVLILTGDNERTGNAIADGLGLEAKTELLPDAKLAEIAALKERGPVAMIGDGINDAPALAAASVGIAMGGGTDVALETADVALLKDRVGGVVELIRLSKATLSNIWQNIALALCLKGVFLATTLFGVTSLWMAILADTGATVLVTANALRLLRFHSEASAGS